MRGKRVRAVGLSIGSRKMALAEVHVAAEGRIEVDRIGVVNTPADAIYTGRIISPAAVSRAIRELFTSSGIDQTKEVSLAISDEGLFVTRLQILPSMSKNETLEALMGEVENYAVLSDGEPALDFQVTSETTESAAARMEVLFLAAPRELVDSYLSAAETVNLKLAALETRPLAILRAITSELERGGESNLPGFQPGMPAMFAGIEENVGMIVIVRDKTIEFIHDIEIGSSNLMEERAFREIAREFRSSVNYHRNTFPSERGIENIVLFIDGQETADIRRRLEEFLNLPIIIPQVPAAAGGNISEEVAGNSLSAYAAIGAAIRMTAGRDDDSINLLSSSRTTGTVNLRKRITLLLVMLLSVVLLSAGARVGIKLKADSIESDLISLRERQDIAEAHASAEISTIQEGIAALKIQTEVTDAAVNSIKWSNCAKILQEIRTIIPKSIWLTGFRWSGSDLSLVGYGLSYGSVFKFKNALVDSPYFDPVRTSYIRSTEISEQSIVRFEIRCGVTKEKLGGGGSGNDTG